MRKQPPPAEPELNWLREQPVNFGQGDPLPGGARFVGIRRWPGRRDILIVHLDDNTKRGDLAVAFDRLTHRTERET